MVNNNWAQFKNEWWGMNIFSKQFKANIDGSLKRRIGGRSFFFYQNATKCILRVFTNLSRTLLACRRSFSRTALVPGSSQSSSALEQQVSKTQQVSLIWTYDILNYYTQSKVWKHRCYETSIDAKIEMKIFHGFDKHCCYNLFLLCCFYHYYDKKKKNRLINE